MSVLIIGAGEVGYMIANRLSEENIDVYIVEKDDAKVARISQKLDVKVVPGSGSSLKTLKEAGLEQTEMLIAVTDSDEVNLVAAFIAGSFADIPTKIVRVRGREYESAKVIFEKDYLDIDLVINPEQEASNRVELLLKTPGSNDVIQVAEGNVRLCGFRVANGSRFVNRTLIDIGKDTEGSNFLVAAIIRKDRLLIPRGNDEILAGDRVYLALGRENDRELFSLLGIKENPAQNVMIYGGSIAGEMLAMSLEKQGLNVKLVDSDEDRCTYLSEVLSRTTVLNSPSVNRELLENENISGMDAFVAASDDEEANILSALLAKRMGNPHVIAIVNTLDYISLVSDIGVDAVVNPRMATVSKILQFIRKGKIFSLSSLSGVEGEVIEVEAMDTSDLVSTPIKDIKWPNGAIVAGIIRKGKGRVVVPRGDTVIDPGDRVVIFSAKSAVHKVEKLLSVKLSYF